MQHCPLCGTLLRENPRYPRHVCGWCAQDVTDEEGRPVVLANATITGGYTAQRPDGSPASADVLAGRVWIDGVALRAQEARFGGVVVQPLDDPPEPAARSRHRKDERPQPQETAGKATSWAEEAPPSVRCP